VSAAGREAAYLNKSLEQIWLHQTAQLCIRFEEMDLVNTAKEMETMTEANLHYIENYFDLERYTRLRELAAELLAGQLNLSSQDVLNRQFWSI
jgi:hypothetical protein